MTAYDEKIKAKRARYAARAEAKRDEAKQRESAARRIGDMIPLGQPILVGHHSEKRHRRDVDRMARGFDRAIEADRDAKRLAHKAATYGKHGVSSDDPNAVDKLRAKLAEMEAKRDAFKARNKDARKAGEETLPAYVLKNLGANIRRYKKRIENLKRNAGRVANPDIIGDGFRIEENTEDNRVRFFFWEKPDRVWCRKMREAGFKWSRTVGAWQRHLNNGGIRAAHRMARELFGWEG